MPSFELSSFFERVNKLHFDGFLDQPKLKWNTRLRSSAGRFVPGARKAIHLVPAVIEIASYLMEEANAESLILDTMAHEMIHYWLWVRRKPFGHTAEFWQKMKVMGVSRYNTVPRQRPYRYIYRCTSCSKEFPSRKKLGRMACATCCKTHSGGRFDPRYKLFFFAYASK